MRQLFCLLAILWICEVRGVPELKPNDGLFIVLENSRFEINCSSPNSITWDGSGPAFKKQKVTAVVDANENISTLVLSNLSEADSQTFRCQEVGGVDTSFNLKVVKQTTQSRVYEYITAANLTCKVDTLAADDTVTYAWSKDGVPVLDLMAQASEEFEEKTENDVSHLLFKKPVRKFAGKYTCEAKYTVGSTGASQTLKIPVVYSAAPFVVPFSKSKNLVQDDKLSIECEVLGYPIPNVTWYKEDKVIEDGVDGFKLSPAETYETGVKTKKLTIENAKLVLESIDFEDKGHYKCVAQSEFVNPDAAYKAFEQTVLVRVKDKLAALWPFLGIVAEVIILCTIIFIYEKKRNKDAADEDDNCHDGATADKKSEGVRHRGSNNPRA